MARSPSRRDGGRAPRERGNYADRRDADYRRGDRGSGRDRRYDDRADDRRRDRSRDRYEDQRGPRRERSRERKRSRDSSPVRDRRHERDRYRDERDYDDRDRKRSRRDEGSPRRSRRDDSRDRRRPTSSRSNQSFAPVVDPAVEAEEAKKAKLAKVEAWKKKMLEKKAAQEGLAGSAASPPATSAGSPAAASPGTTSLTTTAPSSPMPPTDGAKTASPAPYAGKFDHKAIARRAAAAMEREKDKSALGGDIVIPKSTNNASDVNRSKLADSPNVARSTPVNGSAKPTAASTKITGFGLNKASGEKQQDKLSTAAKATASLDEEVQIERKLEKLPDLPPQASSTDPSLANVAEEDLDEGNVLRSDEEEAEAAREAAQKRAEEAQAEHQDVVMADAEGTAGSSVDHGPAAASADADDMDQDDEVDPLDAFMNGLEQPEENDFPNLAIGKGKKKQPKMFNPDDEEADLDAVGNNADDILALAAKRKKPDIPPVDHSKMHYEPFRKSFYSESVELSELTPEEVDILRADLDNITCRGADVPKPILKWSQGGFGSQILDVIREQKFDKPTSIQSQALPAIMSGRDVIGVAKTGSGKTVAFTLPMFRHIKDQRPVEGLDGPIGLILAPTRELATQIFRDCKPYLKALNLRGVCAYGGTPIKDQIADLKRGAEVVVCTPGRIIDLLAANSGRVTNLRRVTYVVLDEADRMFDMGFEPQITKILNNIRPGRQTVLFSATFPKNMENLARKALSKPLEILVGGRSVVASEITQIVEVRKESSKFLRLLELLGELYDKDEDARTLVFVERQETADTMLKDLLRKGYPCVSIHGGREQIDRDEAISNFKAGIFPVMIATSVAARGLDVKQLKLVINFDSPNHGEDYVHRCGRTGRAGNTGTAVTFVTPEQDRFAPFLIKALHDSKQEIPEDLKKLKEAHESKVKSGDAKKIGSGFGGRGIERLEAARDAERATQRKQYKTGDEPDDEEEDKKDKKDDAKSKAEDMIAKAVGGVKDRDAQRDSAQIIPSSLNDHLNNAMKVQKAEPPAPPAKIALNDTLAQVAQRAANINNRLGAKGSARPGIPMDNRGPDAGAFHAVLEINDFPQPARWRVTNRTNVAKVLEATGTSITTKGSYYPRNTAPGPTDPPKLYILVEGDTEVVVENAMRELTDHLKEGTIAALEEEGRTQTSGRYKVT